MWKQHAACGTDQCWAPVHTTLLALSSFLNGSGHCAPIYTELLDCPSEVESVALYAAIPLQQRLDMWPFAIIWGIFLVATAMYGIFHSTEVWLLTGGLIGVLQALAVLSAQWSVAIRCLIRCKQVRHLPTRKAFPLSTRHVPFLCTPVRWSQSSSS